MAEKERCPRGLVDTSVVIDLEMLSAEDLPIDIAISALTMAELATGPQAAADAEERARRVGLIQHAEATFEQLPFDAAAARVYGRVNAAVVAIGRKTRGRRAIDLLIAATALSNELPLYTHNVDDFAGLENLIEIVAVPPPAEPDGPPAESEPSP